MALMKDGSLYVYECVDGDREASFAPDVVRSKDGIEIKFYKVNCQWL